MDAVRLYDRYRTTRVSKLLTPGVLSLHLLQVDLLSSYRWVHSTNTSLIRVVPKHPLCFSPVLRRGPRIKFVNDKYQLRSICCWLQVLLKEVASEGITVGTPTEYIYRGWISECRFDSSILREPVPNPYFLGNRGKLIAHENPSIRSRYSDCSNHRFLAKPKKTHHTQQR